MPNQTPAVEIIPETIGNILRNDQRRLCVPLNQRSYAWEPEHIRDLYMDLAGAISDGKEEYFLGSIVVVKSTEGPIEVFDGQQRLATSMILVSAIRDYFHRSGDTETARIIRDQNLLSPDRKSHEQTPHFKLNAEDHDYFLKRILLPPDDPDRKASRANPQKDSHKRIEKAAQIAAEHVQGLIATLAKTDQGKILHRWLDFLETGARVIWVQVADERTAFTIFETMNDRGLKLSAADLLKNYLYGISENRKDEVVQKWQSMCGMLESIENEQSEIVDYIRAFWVAGHGRTRSKVLYDEIKKEVNNKTKVVSLASALEKRAPDYAALLTASHETWAKYGPGLRAGIETIGLLGITQIRPLLLAALEYFPDKQFTGLVHACTCWSVRCLLSGVPSGTVEDYYSRAALKVSKRETKDVKGVTRDLIQLIPDDTRFKAAAATANVAQPQLARYYLRVLQMQADGEGEPQYVPNEGWQVTLEHVLPGKPGNNWPNITPEDAKANCNRLGNQALLAGSVNSKLGNAKFPVKKIALKESPFSLTQEIAKFKDWGPNEITQHQKRLADLAVLAWPLRRQ